LVSSGSFLGHIYAMHLSRIELFNGLPDQG
jgi:hypothetical protein